MVILDADIASTLAKVEEKGKQWHIILLRKCRYGKKLLFLICYVRKLRIEEAERVKTGNKFIEELIEWQESKS